MTYILTLWLVIVSPDADPKLDRVTLTEQGVQRCSDSLKTLLADAQKKGAVIIQGECVPAPKSLQPS